MERLKKSSGALAMTISLTTFEHELRDRLLDLILGQWVELGVPFSIHSTRSRGDVIDPEALLWYSLEFLPTEARLREGVIAWLHANSHYVIRKRINSLAIREEARSVIWNALISAKDPIFDNPVEPTHGVDSIEELKAFCAKVRLEKRHVRTGHTWLGKPTNNTSTLILQARDLLRGDIRHFLLVYLISNHGEGKLRTFVMWSRYSYRSISETVGYWERAQVVALDRGYCTLKNPEPWINLLKPQTRDFVVVDWVPIYESLTSLLRAIAKAKRKQLRWDSPVVTSFCRTTIDALSSPPVGGRPHPISSVDSLLSFIRRVCPVHTVNH
jgi:hypothetical protein